MGVPVNAQDGNYPFAASDFGERLRHHSGSAHPYPIPPTIGVPFPDGAVIWVRANGAGNVTVTRGAGVTLTVSGDSTLTSQDVAVSQGGLALLWQEAANEWVISGTGLSA